jgi:hypothetical protein
VQQRTSHERERVEGYLHGKLQTITLIISCLVIVQRENSAMEMDYVKVAKKSEIPIGKMKMVKLDEKADLCCQKLRNNPSQALVNPLPTW